MTNDSRTIMQINNQYPCLTNRNVNFLQNNRFTNEEILIINNSKLRPLSTYNNKNDFAELGKKLTYWALFIGVKDVPQIQIIDGISKVIIEHFGYISIEEINTAIELSVAGKLDVDANCYNNFSPLYVCNILRAYCQHRGKVMFEYLKLTEKAENEKKENISESEKEKIMKNAIVNLFKDYSKNKNGLVNDITGNIYDYLVKNKYFNISRENKLVIFKKAKKLMDDEKTKSQKDKKIIEVIFNVGAEIYSKQISLGILFDYLTKTNTDINIFLKTPKNINIQFNN